MNTFGKFLVLIHTILSLCAMTWAVVHFVQAKDLGQAEPLKEVLDYKQDGDPKTWVRHASEYDKSAAALQEARKTRDAVFVEVTPALDSLRDTEPYLPQNHLFYVGLLKQMRESPEEKLNVTPFKDGGLILETPILGRSELELKPLAGVNKSYKLYQADLRKVYEEIKGVEEEIQTIVKRTRKVTAEMTGTDEANKYVKPGLYKLTELEFQAQVELKKEIDNVKPNWSSAIEQARLFVNRRANLEATLDKLKAALPKNQKK